jgi:hypothetical protein
MKLFVLLLLAIYGIPHATAVYLDDAFLRLAEPDREFQFSSSTLYPGESAYMNVSLTIDYWNETTPPKELVIYWVGLRFDWMRENEWIQEDFSLNPYTLDPNDTADFPAFTGQVPSNVTVGNHTLTLSIEYDAFWKYSSSELYNVTLWTYGERLSRSYIVVVHSINEKLYKELAPTVVQQLSQAKETTYLSDGAQGLRRQADAKYGEATSLAEQNKWSEAYTSLQHVQSLLNRIPVEETRFLWTMGLGLTGWIIVIGLISYYLKKRTKGLDPQQL